MKVMSSAVPKVAAIDSSASSPDSGRSGIGDAIDLDIVGTTSPGHPRYGASKSLPAREWTRVQPASKVVRMTITTLSRTHIANGALAEYDAFADLVEGLTDKQWNAAARCDGWQVRDVAGHVVGLAEDTAAGVPGSRNADEEAASLRHETPVGAAARLRAAVMSVRALLDAIDDDAWAGPSGVPDLTLGDGVLTLWYDTYVHADDIRDAIGDASERGAGLDAAICYLAQQLTTRGWGPATLALHETGRYEIGDGGPEITGDALQFMLVATGRADASTMGLDPGVNIY
jgi:uncharacterized protein (TIGR03083 family)